MLGVTTANTEKPQHMASVSLADARRYWYQPSTVAIIVVRPCLPTRYTAEKKTTGNAGR